MLANPVHPSLVQYTLVVRAPCCSTQQHSTSLDTGHDDGVIGDLR